MKLPKVKGSNLARQKLVFPNDFAGEWNLVFIAFLREHQDDVDAWVPFVEGLTQKFPSLCYYEFPTLPDKGFLYRTFLNEGMRAGIPDEATRARTITLYLDKSVFKKALGIKSEQNIVICLFDRSGNLLWQTEGRISEDKSKALQDILLQLG